LTVHPDTDGERLADIALELPAVIVMEDDDGLVIAKV
jgi:hypothetical protein